MKIPDHIVYSVRVRRDKRTDVVRAISRLHRQVQRQREQSEQLSVAVGHGKGRRPAVRLCRRCLALGRMQEHFCAETHERSLVEQKVSIAYILYTHTQWSAYEFSMR